MKTITATIDRESAAALQALLNQDIMLFAPHADIEYGWEETAAGYDYYRLRARLADRYRPLAIHAGLLEFAALPEDNDCLASDLQTRLRYGALP